MTLLEKISSNILKVVSTGNDKAFGRAGNIVTIADGDTGLYENLSYTVLQVVTDSIITTITAEGESVDSYQALQGITLPAGTVLYFIKLTSISMSSGTVRLYNNI